MITKLLDGHAGRALLVAAVLFVGVMVWRDAAGAARADPATEAATRICAKTPGCQGVALSPDTLESRVATFTNADGSTTAVLLVFKDGKFLGTVPLQ